MRAVFRSLKNLPLAAAVLLTTHPALAEFNLGSGRLSGGNKEVFEPVIIILKNIIDGLVYVGGGFLSLCVVFTIYQMAIGQQVDVRRIAVLIMCGAGLLGVHQIPSLFQV